MSVIAAKWLLTLVLYSGPGFPIVAPSVTVMQDEQECSVARERLKVTLFTMLTTTHGFKIECSPLTMPTEGEKPEIRQRPVIPIEPTEGGKS